MVKDIANTAGDWLFRNSWAMIVLVVTLIGGQAISIAVQQVKIDSVYQEVRRIDEQGSKIVINMKADLEVLKANGIFLKDNSEKNTQKLDDIQKLLMGR